MLSTSVLLGLLTLAGCKGSSDGDDTSASDDTNVTDDTNATDDTDGATTGITGKVVWEGGTIPAGAALHVAASKQERVWDETSSRIKIEDPVLPLDYEVVVPPGQFYVSAFIDMTGDSPARPGQGDPEGSAVSGGSKIQLTVVDGASTEAPPISLRLQGGGE
jgi:hypothetical protein